MKSNHLRIKIKIPGKISNLLRRNKEKYTNHKKNLIVLLFYEKQKSLNKIGRTIYRLGLEFHFRVKLILLDQGHETRTILELLHY